MKNKLFCMILLNILVCIINLCIYQNHSQLINAATKSKVKSKDYDPTANDSVKVLLLILSTIPDVETRMQVRSSYAQCTYRLKHTMQTVFIVAKHPPTEDEPNMLAFEDERIAYNDIQMDYEVIDTYKNRSLKMVRALRWVQENFPTVSFVIKTEASVYLKLPELFENFNLFLNSEQILPNEKLPPLIYGRQMEDVGPIRLKRSRYYISKEEYPDDNYPVYMNGVAYILNLDLIKIILDNFEKDYYGCFNTFPLQQPCSRQMLPIEDVFVTGILLKDANEVIRFHDNGFCVVRCNFDNDDVVLNDVWTQHSYTIHNCPQIYEKVRLLE